MLATHIGNTLLIRRPRRKWLSLGLSLSSIGLLLGCAAPTPTTSDKVPEARSNPAIADLPSTKVNSLTVATDEGYIARTLAPDQLDVVVLTAARSSSGVTAKPFERMLIQFNGVNDLGNRQVRITGSQLITNLGQGLFRVRTEYLHEGKPYWLNQTLTVHGMWPLSGQMAFHQLPDAEPLYAIRKILRIDHEVVRPEVGRSYTFDALRIRAGRPGMEPVQEECVAEKVIPAAQHASGLSGQAVVMNCALPGQLVHPVNWTRRLWLADYGVALFYELGDAKAVLRLTPISVEIY